MFELSATQKQLQATAREFAKKEIAPRAAEIDRSEQYPWENVELTYEAGFHGDDDSGRIWRPRNVVSGCGTGN